MSRSGSSSYLAYSNCRQTRERGWLRVLAGIAAVGAGVAVLVTWLEIAYRFMLFYGTYGAKKGLNHVADDYFSSFCTIAAASLAASLAVTFLFPRRWIRIMTFGVAVAALMSGLTLFLMHRTGILVTYGEYAQIYGP